MPSYTSISENLDLKLIKNWFIYILGIYFNFKNRHQQTNTHCHLPKKPTKKPQTKIHHNNQTKKLKAQNTKKATKEKKTNPYRNTLEKKYF